MKKTFLIAIGVLLLLPTLVCADELTKKITKYYKTIYSADENITVEISKDEYDNYKEDITKANPVETAYKKMTTYITSNGSYYKYKNVLEWKNVPSTRSYDIIAIGYPSSVKIHGNSSFLQEFTYSGGGGASSNTNYPQIFTNGVGTSFQLPTTSITTLKQTFSFDVEKNTTSTIHTLYAYGDYSHATSTISLNNSKKYTVIGSSGIVLNASITSYYDSIPATSVSLNVSW